MKSKITKNSTIKNILAKDGAEKILSNHGVPCVSCPMAEFEIDKLEIGEVCDMYGIKLNNLLKDLNKK